MRTTVNLDETLLAEAREAVGFRTAPRFSMKLFAR